MKQKLKVRVLSLLLAVVMTLNMVPNMSLNVYAAEGSDITEEAEDEILPSDDAEDEIDPLSEDDEIEPQNEEEKLETSLDTSNLTFDVTDPDGYVTISFVDNGIRPEGANIKETTLYGTAVGTIIANTQVPFEEGDNIAEVTVRLFDAMGLKYKYTGTVDNDFYLSKLLEFELNGDYYPEFGEFNAGEQSGWCVRLNNWHINQSTSAFEVEDGDTISWLYTCQYGADIGADYSSKSAKITNIKLADESLALVQGEDGNYTCTVPENISTIAFEVELENYASEITVTVDGSEVKYRPNSDIQVTKNSTIVVSTKLEYIDMDNNNEVTTYKDSVTIQLCQPNSAPTVVSGAPIELEVTVGEQVSVDLSEFFTDADNDPLTYTVTISALGINQTLEGSVFTGIIPKTGTFDVVATASDGKASVSHTVTLTVKEVVQPEDPGNTAPNIKAEYAETNSKTYVYSSSYVYIYMDEIFEDEDGDELTYKATCNGEEVAINYNSWSKQYYIMFSKKPAVEVYEIVASDGTADSEVFTAKCIGTSATITAAEEAPLMPGGTYYYYVKGTAENDTFALDYTLDVDESLATEWTSSNNVLTSNGDGTFTVNELTSRQSLFVGVTCGKDAWGSAIYLGTKYFYILPAKPVFNDITAELAEHADNQTATVVNTAVTGGWYSNEFDYIIEDTSICDMATYSSYGLSITPKALGTTKVTATFKYDDSIKCEFYITVTGRSLQIKDQPGVDSVTFEENKTVQLEVLGTEDGEKFTWTSADEKVATIDENGLVTLKGLGQTYITATSSLSTEEKPIKAAMYLQVKENGKVYLDDIAITDYSYFEGFISTKSAFNSAQLTYDWTLGESRYTYNKLAFTPYFDDTTLTAVLHYQVSGGEYQTMDLKNGTAVSITNGLNPGENIVKIDVYPSVDETNITTYTFNIFRPYNPTCTINSMTVYPNGDTSLAYPTYLGSKEGTIFRWNSETGEFVTGWNGNPSTGWSSTVYDYKTFIYGSRTSSISLYPTFGYSGQRVMIYVDGVEFEEAVTAWKSTVIPIDSTKTTKIELHVNSEKYHAEKLAARAENPFAEPEKVYTLYVESVEPLGIEAKILSAELEDGEFYKPGFLSSSYTISALIPADKNSTKLTFTVPSGIEVYKTSVSNANKLTVSGQDEDGNNIYTTDTVTITGTGSYAYATTNIILQVTDEDGNAGQTQYAFTINRRGEKDVYPDSIEEYLCIGSQYTNAASYGLMPERTLKENGGVLSLGNFGGYIVYKYEEPIENDPNNPYGVDFVAYGNAFGNGAHEPGYVQVSKDGKTWYTLAGSEHFDDHNDWDYTMTYTNNNGKSAWTNSDGESGENYNYPSAALYPYFSWTEALESSMTVSGPRLNSSAKDAYGSAAAVLPVFGYVDVNTNGTINGTSNNPYNHPGTLVSGGDMFDLDWAVDENGMPVELDSISYIRIATASSIYAGAIGEKSTEVTAVLRVTNTADEAVGKTAAPTSITVGDKEVTATDKADVFGYTYTEGEAFDVEVTHASEDVNVYINNASGTTRTYTTAPEEGIIRIIVQEGEKEPYICYLVETELLGELIALNNVESLINEIGEVKLGSKTAIEKAREAYNALTDEQKAKVNNGSVLEAAEAAYVEKVEELETAYKTTGTYLENLTKQYAPTVNSVGGEWAVIGLTRDGKNVPEGYYDNVLAYVLSKINDKEQLDDDKSTDNSRVILALTASGYDVTNVAGHNLLEGLTDMDYVTYQGINGPMWALIALNSYGYQLPEADESVENSVTEEKLINYILSKQSDNGCWVLSPTLSSYDTDMTAMAIQALAPYYGKNDDVTEAIDKALNILSTKLQQADGGFASYGTINSESCAQVLTALTALGIDPLTDERFIKNGNSVLDALVSYNVAGGGFKHTDGENAKIDGMATEQGYYSLVSYFRMLNDQKSLYDMTDVTMKDMAEVVEELIKEIGTVTPESKTAIATARAAFDGLSAADQSEVANYNVLTAAEEAYAEIAEKIDNVKELIDAIGTVKYNKTSVDKIEAARKAYDKLTAAEKKYIDNYATLTAAEKKYSQLENANKVMDLIDKIGTVTTDSEDDIKAARKAYDALTKEEKALVDNYSTLTKAERKLAALLEPEGETKTLADGVTKVIGDGDTEVKIGDVLYLVDEAAATLMEKIEALAANADPAAEDIIALYKEYDAMSADLKAQVFNYDDLEAMTNKLGIENHKDAATGMSVDGVEWYIQLVVEEISGTDEYDDFANSIGNNTLVKLWDIYLLNLLTGEKVHTVQNLTLKIGNIDVSDFEEIRIAHLTDAGTMEYLECTVLDGYLTWKTNDLSLFGLIGGQGEAKNVLEEAEDTVEEEVTEAETVDAVIEETEEDGIPWMWIMLIVLGVAVLAAVIVLKKKNESNSVE